MNDSFALLILILFAFPSTVLCRRSPQQTRRFQSQPGSETTQVRMVAETVLMDVQSDMTPDSLGRAPRPLPISPCSISGTISESMAVGVSQSLTAEGRDSILRSRTLS